MTTDGKMSNALAVAVARRVNYEWGAQVCTPRDVWVVHETGTLPGREGVASRILSVLED